MILIELITLTWQIESLKTTRIYQPIYLLITGMS